METEESASWVRKSRGGPCLASPLSFLYMRTEKPIALVDPAPREIPRIFLPQDLEDLRTLVELRPADLRKPSADQIDEILEQATFVIGQTELPVPTSGKLSRACLQLPACERKGNSCENAIQAGVALVRNSLMSSRPSSRQDTA